MSATTNNTVLNANVTTGDTISDDLLTILNNTSISTNEKVQRIKIAFGQPGIGTDVTPASPFPIISMNADTEILYKLLIEHRLTNYLLKTGLSVLDDLDSIRNDEAMLLVT